MGVILLSRYLSFVPIIPIMKTNISLKGKYSFTFRDKDGNITRQFSKENTVVNAGLTVVANLLSDLGTYTTKRINYCAVGDSNTAVTAGDTTLGNEYERKTISSSNVSGDTLYFSTYFALNEAVGTIEEVGMFFDATETANSGVLFSKIVGGSDLPITKDNTESLTIDYSLTISNA